MIRLENISFRRKVIGLGVVSVIITVIVLVTLIIMQIRVYEADAVAKASELTTASLQAITRGIYNLVSARGEAVQQQVNSNLNVARYIVAHSGGVYLKNEATQWKAANQLDQQTVETSLPTLYIGDLAITPNSDPSVRTPVIDEIVDQVGGTTTIFQRMNAAGDMLRVATNVPTKDGKRAVGTYIPAVHPDGTSDPVILSVLKRETYHGLAYVVDAWYVTAYEPIVNSQNEVTGMLYVGVKQESITGLRKAINETILGQTGRIYVINGKGEASGRYVISPDGTQDGLSIWNVQDADGGYPVREMAEKAQTLQAGAVEQLRFRWREAGAADPRWKVYQVAYYAPWDWVIIAEVFEDELTTYDQALKDGHNQLMRVAAISAVGILILTGTLFSIFARSITRPLDHLTSVATRIAGGDFSLTANARGKDEVGMLARAFNEMTARLRDLLAAEKAQRQRLESTVQTYVEHMDRVAQGDLLARVRLNGNSGALENAGGQADAAAQEHDAEHQDSLTLLGEQLNAMTASLQQTIEQVREAATDLSTASSEILAVTIQQSSGASEQSAAIAQTTITVEQVKTIAEQTSLRALEVADSAQQTVQISQAGQQAVRDTFVSMDEIRERVANIAETTQVLSEQTRQISQIIATVNDIAEQSNLLSINAAVEAARAGDAGLGFAIVANEVRGMAEQSRKATEQVRTILASIQKAIQATVTSAGEGQKRVESGVRLAARTGQSIEKLSIAIQDAAKASALLATGGEQQRTGVEQIVEAMHSINQATTQSLASTRQAEQSAKTLDTLAKKMAETVGHYRL